MNRGIAVWMGALALCLTVACGNNEDSKPSGDEGGGGTGGAGGTGGVGGGVEPECTRDAECDDHNACTTDACELDACVNRPLRDSVLDDHDACTVDSCDPLEGVQHVPVNPDDGNACTVDACDPDEGVSHRALQPGDYDDRDPCTIDSCDPVLGPQHAPKNPSDGNPCTDDVCDRATGEAIHTPRDISDGNECTTDRCDPTNGQVAHEPVTTDDGDACTVDACNRDTGNVSHLPVSTDDGNPCTADRCDPANGQVTHEQVVINDGDHCTIDRCSPADGRVTHTPVSVDDGNACTIDACNATTGDVSHVAVATDDANACTVDVCDSRTGAITHPPIAGIDDNNPCTRDTCDPANGTIEHGPLLALDDDDACTVDACTVVGATGQITHTPLAEIDDHSVCTTDTCDPATGEVTHVLVTIDDGDACTTDACDQVAGVSHVPVDPNDNNACTTDACDPATGPTHAAIDPNDNNACTTDGCNPATGPTHVAIDPTDGDPCTADTCDPASGPVHTAIQCVQTTFTGFAGLTAGQRGPVGLVASLNAGYAGAHQVAWKLTVTKAGLPIQGVRAYYQSGAEGADHLTWASFVETDLYGVATVPPGGFAASTLQPGPASTALSFLVPAAGNYNLVVDLVDLSAANKIIGSEGTIFTVAAGASPCGNGTVDFLDGEECDDGNQVGGDGCSAACAIDADVVITEVRLLGAEAIEIHNRGAASIDVAGWKIATRAGVEHVIAPASGGSSVIPAGGWAYGVPGGTSPVPAGAAFTFGTGTNLLDDTGDQLSLLVGGGEASYAGLRPVVTSGAVTSTNVPASATKTTQLGAERLDQALPGADSWCLTFRADHTLGAANQRCDVAIINEVVMSPASSKPKFIELAGPAGGRVGGFMIRMFQGNNGQPLGFGATIQIPAGARIAADGFFVISNTSYALASADLQTSTVPPDSGGATIRLLSSSAAYPYPADVRVLDTVGYAVTGTGTCADGLPRFEGATTAAQPVAGQSLARTALADTDSNVPDFAAQVPTPRLADSNVMPAVTSITPNSAPKGATGYSVVIKGTGFLDGAQVKLGTSTFSASSCTITPTQISCSGVPTSVTAQKVALTVTNPGFGGTLVQVVPDAFTYNQVATGAAMADQCLFALAAPITVARNTQSELLYLNVRKAGVTDVVAGAPAGILAEVGWGDGYSNPSTSGAWFWYPAVYSSEVDATTDRFEGRVTAGNSVTYAWSQKELAYRVSFDGGLNWTYCDLDGVTADGSQTFSTSAMGKMNVN